MTPRALTPWKERDARIARSPFQIMWGGDTRGLRYCVVDTEYDVVPFKGGTLVEAEQWCLDELDRRDIEAAR